MVESTIQIRPATLDDAARLAQLSEQLGYPVATKQILQRLNSLLRNHEHAVLVAASERGEVWGWVHVHLSRLLESAPRGELGGLVVDEQHRGQGIGAQLVQAAESWAREQGLSGMRVRSNVIRSRAHHFYEKLGYRTIKQQVTFEKSW